MGPADRLHWHPASPWDAGGSGLLESRRILVEFLILKAFVEVRCSILHKRPIMVGVAAGGNYSKLSVCVVGGLWVLKRVILEV